MVGMVVVLAGAGAVDAMGAVRAGARAVVVVAKDLAGAALVVVVVAKVSGLIVEPSIATAMLTTSTTATVT